MSAVSDTPTVHRATFWITTFFVPLATGPEGPRAGSPFWDGCWLQSQVTAAEVSKFKVGCQSLIPAGRNAKDEAGRLAVTPGPFRARLPYRGNGSVGNSDGH
jgi:hypothetical protein